MRRSNRFTCSPPPVPGQFRRLAGCVPSGALLLLTAFVASAAAEPPGQAPGILRGVGIDQRLGDSVPLDLEFRNEAGGRVRLGDYFGSRPVVLTLVYYRCPLLCNQVLNGVLKSSQAIPLAIGKDYDVVTVSFDDRESSALAGEKKAGYVAKYRRDGAAEGWHFLTGDKASIEVLTAAVGFSYRYDADSDQFAHASGIMVLTPEGRLSRYFYGIDYSPQDLRLGLVESASNHIGSPVDRILLLCYHYDPLTGRYGLAIARLLRVAGVATLAGLGTFLVVMIRRERRLVRLTAPPAALPAAPGAPAAVEPSP